MANLTENKLDQVLSAATMTTALDALDALLASLPAGSLTDEQRASLPAINVENKVFAEDVLKEMSGPIAGILPSYVNSAALKNDLDIFDQLDELIGRLMQVQRKCTDLQRIAGSEGYGTSLAVYKMVEMANEAGIPGAKEAYVKLKDRFKDQGSKSEKKPDQMPIDPI